MEWFESPGQELMDEQSRQTQDIDILTSICMANANHHHDVVDSHTHGDYYGYRGHQQQDQQRLRMARTSSHNPHLHQHIPQVPAHHNMMCMGGLGGGGAGGGYGGGGYSHSTSIPASATTPAIPNNAVVHHQHYFQQHTPHQQQQQPQQHQQQQQNQQMSTGWDGMPPQMSMPDQMSGLHMAGVMVPLEPQSMIRGGYQHLGSSSMPQYVGSSSMPLRHNAISMEELQLPQKRMAPKIEPEPIPDQVSRKAPKRSLVATIERMEKHKILERKRREKTKELMSELQGLIPSVETVNESLTMNTVLEEAIQHLKKQHEAGYEEKTEAAHNNGYGSGSKALGFAHAFGVGSVARDGFSLMQNDDNGSGLDMEAIMPKLEPSVGGSSSAGMVTAEPTSTKEHAMMLKRMPDQDFKYFRLVLMQETLYSKMLQGWEKRWGTEIVANALSLLCISQQGLSQQELEEIMRIREKGLDVQWSELTAALHADIAVRSEGLLGFVYSAFRLAVERRYLRDETARREYQLQLAEFFEKKRDGDSKRAASELPFALESVGEWTRLRNCLASSLDILYHLYNDNNKADLLRFWRQGDGDDEGATGYQQASESYRENIERFEKEGMAPQMLWQSSLITARFLGDAGQFEIAESMLEKAKELAKELGGGSIFLAEVSLRCAELLNKWAAASSTYTKDKMVRSAFYAKEAADMFSSMADSADSDECATGGGGQWKAQQALEIAEQALNKCQEMRERNGSEVKIAEVLFGQGVLAFCRAEAIESGCITVEGHPRPETEEDKKLHTCELYAPAHALFEKVYAQFSNVYGQENLETVKCVTMMGLMCRRMGNLAQAMQWASKEVKLRADIQGEVHPRTQLARKVFLEIVEERTTLGIDRTHSTPVPPPTT